MLLDIAVKRVISYPRSAVKECEAKKAQVTK